MTRFTLRAAVAAAVILAGAGCAAKAASPSPGIAPAAQARQSGGIPANPVTVVKKAGAVTAEVNGRSDIEGDRYAQGDLPGATVPGCYVSWSAPGHGCVESVEVYTFSDAAAQQADQQRNAAPQDGQAVITGPLFNLTVYGVSADGTTYKFPVSPATLAARVGGTVLSP